jgi:hypothetical protein
MGDAVRSRWLLERCDGGKQSYTRQSHGCAVVSHLEFLDGSFMAYYSISGSHPAFADRDRATPVRVEQSIEKLHEMKFG